MYLGSQITAVFDIHPVVDTTYYIEIIRESATLATMNIYSDSDYSTLTETKSLTCNSDCIAQRYVKMSSFANASYAGGNLDGEISDLLITNGQVTPCS